VGGDGDAVVRSTQLPVAAFELYSSGILGMATASWASLADKDDDTDEEELAPMTPPTSFVAAHPSPCVGRDAEASKGWHEVLPR
jgi:hypothetical protein